MRTIDDLWADHLAAVTELRSGIQWVAWGGRDPLFEFLTQMDRMFRDMMAGWTTEIARRIEEARVSGLDPTQRGATWTYLTTDNPFGSLSDRIRKGIVSKLGKRLDGGDRQSNKKASGGSRPPARLQVCSRPIGCAGSSRSQRSDIRNLPERRPQPLSGHRTRIHHLDHLVSRHVFGLSYECEALHSGSKST